LSKATSELRGLKELVKVLLAKEWVIRRPVLITPRLHQRLFLSATGVPLREEAIDTSEVFNEM